MRRTLIVGALMACGMMATTPTFASPGWGVTTCSQTPTPACRLGVGTGGSPGSPGSPSHRAPSPGGHKAHSGDGHSTSPDQAPDAAKSELAHCAYSRSDFQPPGAKTTAQLNAGGSARVRLVAVTHAQSTWSARMLAAQPPGAWYIWKCTTAGVTDGLYHPPVWIPDGKQVPQQPPLPAPAQLAQAAYRQLALPSPTIAVNPVGDQLVHLPTWLWLTAGWTRTSATASVPGESVTATASPGSVSWSMGDGGRITCMGPGTPFRSGDNPTASSPDCAHTYLRSSADQPGQVFSVAATVHWTVTWTGAGQSGTFPGLTTTAHTTLRVAESQALNTGG